MDKEQEFYTEFQRLKSRSEIPGAYEDVLNSCLDLLERIRGFHRNENNPNPIYSEGKELCHTVLNKVEKYILVDSYRKRLENLNHPYEEFPYIELAINEASQPKEYSKEPISPPQPAMLLKDLTKNQGFKVKRNKRNSPKNKIGRGSYAEPKIDYESNPLTDIAIIALREILLKDLRQGYRKKKSEIRRKELEKVYGSQIDSLEGLMDALEEIYSSGVNVFADPVFRKIDYIYNNRMEGFEDSKYAEKHKERYQTLKDRHDSLMEKIDFVGKRISKIERKRLKEEEKDAPVSEELDDLLPPDDELRDLEDKLESE